MTKKDYEIIAKGLRNGFEDAKKGNSAFGAPLREQIQNEMKNGLIAEVCKVLMADNPAFSVHKFTDAVVGKCGLDETYK